MLYTNMKQYLGSYLLLRANLCRVFLRFCAEGSCRATFPPMVLRKNTKIKAQIYLLLRKTRVVVTSYIMRRIFSNFLSFWK